MFVNLQEMVDIGQHAKQTNIVGRSINESQRQSAFSNLEIKNCSDFGVNIANGDNCTRTNNALLKIEQAKLETGTEGSGNRYRDDNDTFLYGQTTATPFPFSKRGIEDSESLFNANTADVRFPRSNEDDPHDDNDTVLHGHNMFPFNFSKRGMEDAQDVLHGQTTSATFPSTYGKILDNDTVLHGRTTAFQLTSSKSGIETLESVIQGPTTGTTFPPSYRDILDMDTVLQEKTTGTLLSSGNRVLTNEHKQDSQAKLRTIATVSSKRLQGIRIHTPGSTFDHETVTSPLPASALAVSNGADFDHDIAVASHGTTTTRIQSREPLNDTHVLELENGTADAVGEYLSHSSFREVTDPGVLINAVQHSSTRTPLTNNIESTPDFVTEDNTTTTPLQQNGYISRSTYELFLEILSYCNRVCFVIAMLLSLLSFIIFCDSDMHSPTRKYLVAFNLARLLNVLMGVMSEISESLNRIKLLVHCSLFLNTFLAVALTRSSYWLNCVISSERFVAIAFPFKAKSCKVVKHPLIFIVAVVSINLLFHAFTLFKFHLIADVSIANHTIWKYELTDTFHGNRPVFDWMSLTSKLLFVLLPFVGSLLMNIGSVTALLRHRQLKRRLNILHGSTKERYNTKCILVSTFLFVVLELPVNINSVAANVIPEYGFGTRYFYLFQLIMKVGILCSILSGCINFISYMTISTQFRNVFLCLCRKLRPRRNLKHPNSTEAHIRTVSAPLSDISTNNNNNITETSLSAHISTNI